MAARFRIHPGIGLARLGNSTEPSGFFIGPEHPDIPANWVNGAFASFRDTTGRIKRQAARFRVFEYDEDERGQLSNPREIALGPRVTRIEWRVHVSNKKASFFAFVGQEGSDDLFVRRQGLPASDPVGSEEMPNLRNPRVKDRATLEIDPGEQMISTANGTSVVLANPNPSMPDVTDLGELRLDGARLVFLGGHGDSGSKQKKARRISHYANNDTWYDDASDGSVKARIFFADGTHQDADAAWVLVGPPDFAPGIPNVVTLFDTLWDLAVHHLQIPEVGRRADGPFGRLAEQKRDPSLANYGPSFTREIYPLLERPFGAFWTFEARENNQSLHLSFKDYARLAAHRGDPGGDRGQDLRNVIQARLRDPNGTVVDWKQMPRGLGDRYDDFDSASGPTSASFLSLTRIQYAVLQRWIADQFDADWSGEPVIPEAVAEPIPDNIDAAALLNAVGGPFYPGIDVSWLIRSKDLYAEPFRLKVPNRPESEGGLSPVRIGALRFGPGFFSQQMALPWQADFYDCKKEEKRDPAGDLVTFMWWTAHRPDSVLPATATHPSDPRVRWVRTFDGDKTPEEADDLNNLDRFLQMKEKWWTLRFVVGDRSFFKEEP